MADRPPIFFYNRSWDPRLETTSNGEHRWHPGNWVWTVKTCTLLSSFGTRCTMVNELPSEGIVVAHRDHLPDGLRPGRKRLLVCLVADVTRHPFAQLHVFQNPTDPALIRPSAIWPAAYVPLWPESDLVPRDETRGDRFENISYFGLEDRLAPELRTEAWSSHVRGLGLTWRIMPRDRWNDYGDTDAVVAVRRFEVRPRHHFPPSKLYNAWLAGVPAILSADSAYRAARRSEHDFIEVRSLRELRRALERLQRCPEERRAMTANARLRAREIATPQIAGLWQDVLARVIVPQYEAWCRATETEQQAFLRRRLVAYRRYQLEEMARRVPNAIAKARGAVRRLLSREA